jgi:cytochrome c peroxidase
MITANRRSGTPLGAQRSAAALALGLALGASACNTMEDLGLTEGFTQEEWSQIRAIQPLATEQLPNPSNNRAFDDDAARLGQMLFFEVDFSPAIKVDGPSGKVGTPAKVSCANCHDPNRYFIDSRTTDGVSHGVDYTTRSSPPMTNMGWYKWFTLAGRLDSLSMQGANAPEAGTDVASNRLYFAHMVYKKYRDVYDAVFPDQPLDPALDPDAPDKARFPQAGKPKASAMDPDGPWEMMAAADRTIIMQIMANAGKAYEAYERKLVTPNSRFERFVKGEEEPGKELTVQEKRGLKLFVGKAACVNCHTGPILSDNGFHNIGVPQTGNRVPITDGGRFQDIPKLLGNPYRGESAFSDDPEAGKAKLDGVRENEATKQEDGSYLPLDSTKGQFRTSGLLNCAETAPYFHDGSARTLRDVVVFYNRGGGDAGTFMGTKDPRMVPLGLSDAQIDDLVAFLKTLTGEHPPEEWRANTAAPPLPPATP